VKALTGTGLLSPPSATTYDDACVAAVVWCSFDPPRLSTIHHTHTPDKYTRQDDRLLLFVDNFSASSGDRTLAFCFRIGVAKSGMVEEEACWSRLETIGVSRPDGRRVLDASAAGRRLSCALSGTCLKGGLRQRGWEGNPRNELVFLDR